VVVSLGSSEDGILEDISKSDQACNSAFRPRNLVGFCFDWINPFHNLATTESSMYFSFSSGVRPGL